MTTYVAALFFRGFCFLTLALSLSSCGLMQLTAKSPEVKLEQVRVENISLGEATLMFDLNVFNPNTRDLQVDGIDYKLSLNAKDFAAGKYEKVTELPGQKTVKVSLPIKVEFQRVFESLMSALKKPETKYMLEGSARLGVFTIPFREDGVVKWQTQQSE